MIAMNEPAPPLPNAHDYESLSSLISLLADPAAAKKRIEDLQAAHAAAEEKLAAADKRAKEVDDAHAVAEAKIAEARATHDREIAAAFDSLERQRNEHAVAVEKERSAIAALRARVEADARQAEVDKREYQRRLAAMEGRA
jgi:hypothetical protein